MRIPISAALLLLAAVPSLAQTTTTVDVLLTGCGARPKTVTLVPNGNEGNSHEMTYIGSDHWRLNNLPSFNARGQRASLRLGGKRTTCALSEDGPDPNDADKRIAFFRFRCAQETYWSSLSIVTTPTTVPMQYKRVMPDPGCVDSRAEITGTAEITDVAVYNESIFVNLGEYDPLRPFTDYAVAIQRGVFGKQTLGLKPLALTRAAVLTDLMLRRSSNAGASPKISDNLRSVRGRDLVPFDKITLTVK
jgi:hypothetical protein